MSAVVGRHYPRVLTPKIKTANLKSDRPGVQTALERLAREIAIARQEGCGVLKVIHGYGSTGVGGDIRIAVQKRLRELFDSGEISGCIFGENWSTADDETWQILQVRRDLKNDPDLGRRNPGITMVIL
ncbi:MAG TPA: hypothetical protein VMG82_27300 [Candidatus Sulfotelmatobacter sp.]|nr:hypothetical protein [Candidatus Sulfotelmatobacter sp.]